MAKESTDKLAKIAEEVSQAQRPSIEEGVGLLHIDRDICKGSTDTPRGATL